MKEAEARATCSSCGRDRVLQPDIGRCILCSRVCEHRLSFLSPIECEEKHYAEQATAEPTNLKPRQS